jgi:predicted ATPase
MLIQRIEVRGFRSLRELVIDCESLCAFLGRNGAGKSSILSALDSFYDTAAKIVKEDFYNHDQGSPIELRLTYGNLQTDERDEFRSYLDGDVLMVTKRITWENDRAVQRYYAAAKQIPQFAEIRKFSGKRDRIARWNELVETESLAGLGTRAKSADQVERMMADYERGHAELLQPVEREEQFFGPKNIGGGKLDKYTRFVLVPAVREASAEIDRKGVIYQLIDMIVLRRVNARKDVQELRTEFSDRVKKVFSTDNLTELADLAVSISDLLGRYAPGALLNLKWGEVSPPELKLPPALATLVEEEFESSITHSGHGLQRALILTLLQHLALAPSSSEEDNGAEDAPSPSILPERRSPDLILAIEEPELYLHPSRCKYLSDLLLQLSQVPVEASQPKNQIIYCTHSPYFVDLQRFDQIQLTRKKKAKVHQAPECEVNRFSREDAATRLAKICDRDPREFTAETFQARSSNVMTTIVNEGFFADKTVVVEGASEVGVLWKLQEVLNKAWAERGIVVVPANGKNNLDRPVVVFSGLGIPTYFVFDGDSSAKGNHRKQAEDRNGRYLRLAGAEVEAFPTTQVHPAWAVFNDKLETELMLSLGERVYDEIRGAVAKGLGYDRPSEILKNPEGGARFVEDVYSRGLKIPILEQIVEQVTAM